MEKKNQTVAQSANYGAVTHTQVERLKPSMSQSHWNSKQLTGICQCSDSLKIVFCRISHERSETFTSKEQDFCF